MTEPYQTAVVFTGYKSFFHEGNQGLRLFFKTSDRVLFHQDFIFFSPTMTKLEAMTEWTKYRKVLANFYVTTVSSLSEGYAVKAIFDPDTETFHRVKKGKLW